MRKLELDKSRGWIDCQLVTERLNSAEEDLSLFWVIKRVEQRPPSGHFMKTGVGSIQIKNFVAGPQRLEVDCLRSLNQACACWDAVERIPVLDRRFDKMISRVPFNTENPDFWKGRRAFILI